MKKNLLNLRTLATALLIGAASSFSFAQVTTLPVIDGDGTDAVWATAPVFTCDSAINNANITDADDFSGSFKALWSVDSLYLLISINDEVLDNSNVGVDQYLNDNVVIYIDAFNQKTHDYTSNTQVFYEVYFDDILSVKGRTGANWVAPGGLNHANVVTEGTGYVSEIAISWEEFGLKPFSGTNVGFDVKLNDNDDDGSGRGLLAWNDVSDNGWQYPDVFGNIYLNRDGSVSGVKASDAAVTVDGLANDPMWLNAETWTISNTVTGNVGGITDDNDYSGIAKFIWTADSLFVFYSIKDDVLYSGDGNNYANDNATIAIDLFNKKTGTYIDTTQHFWEIYWFDAVETGKMGPIKYKKIVDEGTGYTLEAGIPFAAEGYTPAEGNIIGVDVKLNENDGDGRDQLTYNDTTDNIWQYPSVFGSAKLAANGKVRAIATPFKPNPVVTVTNSDVNITWTADPNAAEYVLYKDGVELASQSTLTYDDNGLANGTYKYTLQAVSSEGAISPMSNQKSAKVEVSGVNNPLTSDVKVYPNPAQNEINISNSDLINSFAVMSITGQVVARVNDINATTYKFDLNGVNSGLYILSVQTANGTSLVKITVK